MIIDGWVNTISAHKVYLNNVDGAGLWVTNSQSSPQNPQFATFYGLESDSPFLDAIRIEAGNPLKPATARFYFTDTQVHGSITRSNVWVDPNVDTVSFKGGVSSGACGAGFEIYGHAVSITSVDVISNSIHPTGCTIPLGTDPGIIIGSQARMTAVTGNKIGGLSDPLSQKYGIVITSTTDQFAIVGNVIFNNATAAISNPTSAASSRIVASNACPTTTCL